MASGLSWEGKSMGRYTGRIVPTSQPANSAANDGTSALLPEETAPPASPPHAQSVRRFLFLGCRHVNSTLDSKHECEGGASRRKITCMGGVITLLSVCQWCLANPLYNHVSQGALNADLG